MTTRKSDLEFGRSFRERTRDPRTSSVSFGPDDLGFVCLTSSNTKVMKRATPFGSGSRGNAPVSRRTISMDCSFSSRHRSRQQMQTLTSDSPCLSTSVKVRVIMPDSFMSSLSSRHSTTSRSSSPIMPGSPPTAYRPQESSKKRTIGSQPSAAADGVFRC